MNGVLMKKKIIVISAIIIAICFLTVILGIVHNTQSEKYTIENISSEYFQSDGSTIATVNDENITSKDICLIKYSYHTKDALNQAIEQKAIIQLANDDGFSLNQSVLEKEINYIDGVCEKLNLPENEDNIAFKEDLKRNHLEMATSIKYQSYIEKQISHQEFSCDNEAINEKYEKYKVVYKEWEDEGKGNSKLYEKMWSLREEIAQDYIDYRIDQLQIKKY